MTRKFTTLHVAELEALQGRINELTSLRQRDTSILFEKVRNLSVEKARIRGVIDAHKKENQAMLDAVFVSTYPDELLAILKEYCE